VSPLAPPAFGSRPTRPPRGCRPPLPPPAAQVWVRHAAARRPGSQLEQPTAWRCRSVGSFKGFPLQSACFSPDGSVLAIAAGAAATLWDPASNRLVAALHFVAGSPFLVGLLRPAGGAAGGSGVVVGGGGWQACL
jgi:hypothetical protein